MKFFRRKKKVVKQIPKKQLSMKNPPIKRIPEQQIQPTISLEDSIRQIKEEAKEAAATIQSRMEKFTAKEPKAKESRKPTTAKSKPKEKSIPENDPGKEFLKTFKKLTYSRRSWCEYS